MPRKKVVPPGELRHRWYLAEWAEHFGKRQADAQRELGWNKSTASFLWNNKQRYSQNLVEEAADWLGIEPYELLMKPEDAMALRRIRSSARQIAAEEEGRAWEGPPPAKPVIGS